jgi:hypothetical protein
MPESSDGSPASDGAGSLIRNERDETH